MRDLPVAAQRKTKVARNVNEEFLLRMSRVLSSDSSVAKD